MNTSTLQQIRDLLEDHATVYPELAALEEELGQRVAAFRDAGVEYTQWARRFGAAGDPVFFFALEAPADFMGNTLADLRHALSPLQELAALATACAEAGDRLNVAWRAAEEALRTRGLLE
jgi:hypothetical protein